MFAGFTVTTAISPWWSFDPINPIKVVFLSSVAFCVLGVILSSTRTLITGESRNEILILLSFCLSLTFPLFLTGAPISQQFWGVFGRNTGYLTYLSLALIVIGISLVSLRKVESVIVRVFLATSIVLTIYGTIQVFNLDFVNWSQKNVFATLGNVNFFSAFLGISIVTLFALLVGGQEINTLTGKTFVFVLIILQLVLLYFTDSIQGFATAFVGIFVVFWLWSYRKSKIKFQKVSLYFLVAFFSVTILPAFGLFGKGPLARFLYQDSNVFRMDYMHAGLEMTVKNPWTGIGLDSYDNWYRTERGFVSAFRTGVSRTANTAHNVILDLSSGGGLFLLLSYLAILLLVIWRSASLLARKRIFSDYYLALISGWFAYQFQTLISINQIGLGIWGWIFTGGLLSVALRERLNPEEIATSLTRKNSPLQKKAAAKNVLPPFAAILAVIGIAIGFASSYVLYSTDKSFRKAFDSRDVSQMQKVVELPASNAFHFGKTLESAIQVGDISTIDNISKSLIERFPREIFAWDVRSRLQNISEFDRNIAVKRVIEIDPNQICNEAEPITIFGQRFDQLPPSQKSELLRWWGLAPKSEILTITQISEIRKSVGFASHAKTICGR
jgi:O-antigen ligase